MSVKEPKATGVVFFSLFNEDDIIEYQRPRSGKFIAGNCVDEIIDPETAADYIEVYGEERNRCLTNSTVDWKKINFSEVECGGSGRIAAASIDVESASIFIKREAGVENILSPVYNDDDIDEDIDEEIFDDYEVCNSKPFQHKIGVFNWNRRHRKGEEHKPRRNNLKTMPENKQQRNNRYLLSLVKLRCVEEDFCNSATLVDYDLFFSETDFDAYND